MTGLTVTVWLPPGTRVEVPASPTPVPGLVVNQDARPGRWVVTHAGSGAAIFKLPDPEAALHAAIRLGELADWTLPASLMRDLPGLEPRVIALGRELDCWALTVATSSSVPDDELAEAEQPGGAS